MSCHGEECARGALAVAPSGRAELTRLAALQAGLAQAGTKTHGAPSRLLYRLRDVHSYHAFTMIGDAQEDGAPASAPPDWLSLPQPLLCAILALLPVDERLRAAEVCRAWSEASRERRVWARVDLSSATGGLSRDAESALLRSAAARSAGFVEKLFLDSKQYDYWRQDVDNMVTANAASLRELHVDKCGDHDLHETTLTPGEVEALVRSAPHLRVLDAAVRVKRCSEALPVLRKEGLFAPLDVCKLEFWLDDDAPRDDATVGRSLLSALGGHAPLRGLRFWHAFGLDTADGLDAVVDLALAHRFATLELGFCDLVPACVPALARLLGSTSLRTLILNHGRVQNDALAFLDGPSALLFAAALRANCTLHELTVSCACVWEDEDVATALIGAVMAHPSLRVLDLSDNTVPHDALNFATSLLAALAAADGLQTLKLRHSDLTDETLRQLAGALPRAMRLQMLELAGNHFSDDCVRDALLPAVRANTSLRELNLEGSCSLDAAAEVERVLEARRAAP